MQAAPMARLQQGKQAAVTTGTPNIPAFPAQWFTAYTALSPECRYQMHTSYCGFQQSLILCRPGHRVRGVFMSEFAELGRFGDRRLEKGGPCCTRRWFEIRAPAFDGSGATARERCGLRGSCVTKE
jgi:hypothetical protein